MKTKREIIKILNQETKKGTLMGDCKTLKKNMSNLSKKKEKRI